MGAFFDLAEADTTSSLSFPGPPDTSDKPRQTPRFNPGSKIFSPAESDKGSTRGRIERIWNPGPERPWARGTIASDRRGRGDIGAVRQISSDNLKSM